MGAERSEELREHTLGIRQHVVVPEADHAPALRSEIVVSLPVALRFCMLPAIDLDDDLSVDAGEVRNIWRDRMLATETPSAELVVAQACPQSTFGIRHVASKAAEPCFVGFSSFAMGEI